jgi:hypothetical protein
MRRAVPFVRRPRHDYFNFEMLCLRNRTYSLKCREGLAAHNLMGGCVCEKVVPPQQALVSIILSQVIITYILQCLANVGVRRRCHGNFHSKLLKQWNNTYRL